MPQFPYEKISYELLSDFEPRTKDIVIKRFGLENGEPFTLERIGEDHDITRERVRQIVDQTLNQIKENHAPSFPGKVFSHFSSTIKKLGNAKREDLLLEKLRGDCKPTYVVFLLNLGDQFLRHRETDEVHPFWTVEQEVLNRVPSLLQHIHGYFEKKKDAAHLRELQEIHEGASLLALSSLLEISKRVVQAHDGRWGLRDWAHINPRTIRDKAYIALRAKGEPLHFREVAEVIEELQEKFPTQKLKEVLPQTVHNELIKDPRFVLVGRGMYALQDWGYEPGTVKDVLLSILQKESQPLTKEQIIEKTLSQRQVRETTILLNLQDRSLFARDELGRYYVR
ncbi:MAG: hypothetical protein HYS52_01215 [Candidatus Wildermuthbacteria bacterium]|nr:hypothetical protein [Candidatus Wildermuthbacteria bacterium]